MTIETRNELITLIRSRCPIIQIDTHEEVRILKILSEITTHMGWKLHVWTIAEGLRNYSDPSSSFSKQGIEDALLHIKNDETNGVFSFLDIAPHIETPLSQRIIKDIAENYDQKPRTLIFIGGSSELPKDLKRWVARYAPKLPDRERVYEIYLEQAYKWLSEKHGRKLLHPKDAEQLMLRNLLGLAEEDIERLVSNAIRTNGQISFDDAELILKFKKQAIGTDLIKFESDTTEINEIGGLEHLKSWLSLRRSRFLGDSKADGLPAPKGILILGIQGCGKSLAAKAVANAWKVPLIRLDLGMLYSKWLGETEHNMREALEHVEAMAPCVLWIDEIEKGISSDSDGLSDGGVSRRILATLLVWMAERTAQVFIVATSNDVSQLPPELIRKGRLDEIFFVELPNESTREEIFCIHLKKRRLDPINFDLLQLSNASDKFSGAEIEQAIVSAMYSVSTSADPVTTTSILNEIKQTRPLAVVMSEKVMALRDWAAGRTVRAD